ncbi:UNVERIFIED_CONTAM: hypothetical protein FKN15_041351, partial [Acipenser sinensis]
LLVGSKALEYSNGIFDCQSPTSPFMGSLRVLHLVEDLRGLLELMEVEEKEGLRCQLPDSTAQTVVEWLQGHVTNGHISVSGDVYQERLTRLESDKESLVLQVSVLTDQVEAQGEKIRDLDFCLEEHREKLNATEEMLQQELLSRSALETQKLDLMAEISNLKLKMTAMEKDRLDFDERFRDSESLMAKLSSLKIKVGQMQYEKQRMEHKSQTLKDELVMLKDKLEQKDGEVKRLWDESLYKITSETGGSEKVEKDLEVQKMKRAVESLMAANEEKDRKIEELRQSLTRYKKVQDMVMSAQVKKDKLKECSSEESQSDSSVSVSTAISVSIESEKPPSPVATNEGEIVKTPDEVPVEMHKSVLQVSIPALASSRKNSSEQSQEQEDWGLSEMSELDMPFAKWTKEQVCNWLQEQGLGLNVNFAKRWIMSGQTLLQASQQDLERDDLLTLKVGSVLHHLSIKRAIQVLRINNFEPNCLRRRPSDEVLEPRFNVETMALLLNIPPNKTLLRRHLATHFNLLIGQEAQQQKQESVESPDYTLLTATAKVKPRKLAFGTFGSLRKKKQEESEEYVCPMDVAMPTGSSFQNAYKRGMEIRLYDDDLDRLEQVKVWDIYMVLQ